MEMKRLQAKGGFGLSLSRTDATGTTRRRSDPRHDPGLSPRDFVGLAFIGKMGVAAQYQLHGAVFTGKSEVVVSRCTKRLARLRLISVMRWNKTGINLLKLTGAGRDALISSGHAREEEVFTATWPSPSSLAHHLWIVDASLAARELPGRWDVLPCWSLRRRFAGTNQPVPDLLAVRADGARLLAIEIDLGGENLRRVLLPKLESLSSAIEAWARDANAAIIVLTVGDRRCASLARRASEAGLSIITLTLPTAIGRPAPTELAKIIQEQLQR